MSGRKLLEPTTYIYSHYHQGLVQLAHLVLQSRREKPHCALFVIKCDAAEAYLEKAALSSKTKVTSHHQPCIPTDYFQFIKQSTVCLLIFLHTKHRVHNRWSSLSSQQENTSSVCSVSHFPSWPPLLSLKAAYLLLIITLLFSVSLNYKDPLLIPSAPRINLLKKNPICVI